MRHDTPGATKPASRFALRVLPVTLALLVACARAPAPAGGDAAASAEAGTEAPNDSIVPRAERGAPDSLFPAPNRPVSSIVSPRWSDEDERDDAGEARRVLDATGVIAGTAVADVGAGDGYYALRAADRVGPTGRVWAEDIVPAYLAELRRRLAAAPRPNVVLALGEPHDPRLPPASVDVVLMIHMYHEITQPFGLLYNLAPALRPGARVAILDQDRPTSSHGTPPARLRCELEAMGYRWQRSDDVGDGAYLALFAGPASPDSLTAPSRVTEALRARGCGPSNGGR